MTAALKPIPPAGGGSILPSPSPAQTDDSNRAGAASCSPGGKLSRRPQGDGRQSSSLRTGAQHVARPETRGPVTAGETAPIELSQCDACGQRMPAAHLRTVWSAGCETAACRACMGEEEDGVCPCGWPYEYETSTHQEGHGEWVTEERPWCPRCDAEPERVPSEPAPFDDSEIPY